MNKIKTIFLFIIITAVLCSCCTAKTPPEKEESDNLITENGSAPSVWNTVTDLNGDKINYTDDISSFTVNYALCWDPYSDGYKKMDSSKEWFGYKVMADSTFEVINYPNDFAVCTHSSVYVYPDGVGDSPKIEGVFIYDGESILFYPYYKEENSEKFFFLHKRDEYSENALREKEKLVFSDGTAIKVQPAGIVCRCEDKNGNIATLSKPENFEEHLGILLSKDFEYIEATVCFDSITFIGSSNANDTPVLTTNITGITREITIGE